MSTKATILYEPGKFHLYWDTVEWPSERRVYLEIENPNDLVIQGNELGFVIAFPQDMARKLGIIP